ncbi:T9SS type A sorting domain-containing protein [Chishuiella sp.]|uniref:T9SS type A sorting domain-containing protein n=1 Tax=Chishuiella sp. TaxID=1969467 RepID=UPI0028B2072B|nr:T9SS type A sorting domain-containing protein [Chishuiella sp.]
MKKIFTLLSLAIISVVNAQYDGFAYNTALDQNGWTTHSGATGTILPLTTSSDDGNSLAYSGIPTSKGNRTSLVPSANISINKSLNESSKDVVYASFLIKVVDIEKIPANTVATAPGAYFFFFSNNEKNNVSDGTGSVSRIGLRKGKTDGTFNISLANTTGGSIPESELYGTSPIDYKVNQTYFVVVKYDMTGDKGKSSIWVNTLSENDTHHTSEAGTSNKQTEIKSVALRERISQASGVEIDELRLGTSWDEVTKATLSTDDIVDKNRNIISNNLIVDQFKVLSNQQTSIEIYSLSGQLVKSSKLAPQSNVNISNLSSGVYVIKITEGTKTYTQKIIKK